ncbi:hypothetical protein HUE56_06205 (plasmid) [Azospirillum oryzae]|uniref:Uncharacterized protein n=1 Tax=Azospirillum oryzae TaxID=286727 RepID=A0A6N1AG58_9PROT|nr:hypothetical protein [Azospirillum oryzae]KAA0588760.1 hypothetical protein FZ938_12935 [Azospirillum oryzae]QKS50108.1 hypothetical protein HUE56_06205 [Azospirillum oryzae]GLR81375.1 hypothetical protein GCM10007856_40600 [Azospirillum oryzae]
MEAIEGERVAGYLILTDIEGRRHALRASTVLGISEADDFGDECLLQMPGGRLLRVKRSLDEILTWLC